LVKNAGAEEIKMAIQSVYETGYYFSDLVSQSLLKRVANTTHEVRFNTSINLTKSEMETLKLICQERTTSEIANELNQSPRTVEGYRSSLLIKIGVRNIAGLVLYAVRHKIVV
jgi:DNA-binding NarL/FixJ family response regulator